MHQSGRRRVTLLSLFIAAFAAACAAQATEPLPPGPAALRDSIPEGNPPDSLDCRSGYVIINGRWTCGESGADLSSVGQGLPRLRRKMTLIQPSYPLRYPLCRSTERSRNRNCAFPRLG